MAQVISLDKIADSIEALKDADEQRRELNWRIWRQVQTRRVNQAMLTPCTHGQLIYLSSRLGAIETLYDERYGLC